MKITAKQQQELQELLNINNWTPQEYYTAERRKLIHHLRDILKPGLVNSLDYQWCIDELKEMYLIEVTYDINKRG